MKFAILVDLFLLIITILSACLGLESKVLKGIMHFHYMTYLANPGKELRHKIYNFGRPSLDICTMDLVCLNHAPE